MDPEIEQKIEKTVRKILEKSDMDEMTEFKIRKQASEALGLDLSGNPYKPFVRRVVNTFLEEQKAQAEAQVEEHAESEEEEEGKSGGKEFDENGDLIVCRLSNKRRVTIQDFRGKTLVSIREYYTKDGKELPSSKGISMTEEQWSVFKKNIPSVEKAIAKMESRVE